METTSGIEIASQRDSQNLQEEYASIPNSQTSSLNDQFSVNTSQTSVSVDQHPDMSGSEGNVQKDPKYALAGSPAGGLKKLMPISMNVSAEVPARNTSHPSRVPHGQKRMSNGHLKSPSVDSPTSPSAVTFQESHARRLSNVSSGSQVGELAAQLRTRLSYAMLKVQNGWENRTIEEVESLASRQSSIAPPTPIPLQVPGSPSSEDQYHRGTKLVQPPKRSVGSAANNAIIMLDHSKSPQMHRSTTSGPGHALLYPNLQPPKGVQHRPNRSRDGPIHSGNHSSMQAPRLAPAFDEPSRDGQRVAQPNPPRLDTHSVSNLSNHGMASTLSGGPPSTPPPRPISLAKSPSCTTPMEQDAIETLLTMSSPGNSQHGPRYSHLPGSPLRNHFQPQERLVRFPSSDPPQPTRAPKIRLRTDEDVDRYLDEMSKHDESSDD